MYKIKNSFKIYIILLLPPTIVPFPLLSMFSLPRSIQQAKLEAKTQKEKAQRKKQCYDLMMILDDIKTEKPDSDLQATGLNFVFALYQGNFPIIISRNIVYNVCVQACSTQQTPLSRGSRFTDSDRNALHLISLTNNDWYGYDHPQTDLMLFVPKKYTTLLSNAANIDDTKLMRTCGFNVTNLTKIENFSLETLISYTQQQKSTKEEPITQSIESMFIVPNKPNAPTWNIYLTGHGETNLSIAGLKKNDFLQLLSCFEKIKCSFLHYTSCYSGGFNRDIVQQELSRLKVNFIVSAQGINEEITRSMVMHSTFFKMAEYFFGNPTTFIQQRKTSKSEQKDPIASIVNTILMLDKDQMIYTQPFVYIPSIGTFNALSVDKSIKIITESITKAHAFEGKNIELTDPAIKAVILYPNYINIPIKIKANVALVSPTQSGLIDAHIFENIIYQDSLAAMICQSASLNRKTKITPDRKTKATLFAIKKLHCFNYPQSGFAGNEKNELSIENIIIYINDIENKGTRVTVLFNINDKTYYMAESFKKVNLNDFNAQLFEAFNNKLTPQEISTIALMKQRTDDLLFDFMPTSLITYLGVKDTDKQRTVADIIALVQSKINPTTQVQQIGALKQALLQKQQTIETHEFALKEKKQELSKTGNPTAYMTYLEQLKNKGKALATKTLPIRDIKKQELAELNKKIDEEYAAAAEEYKSATKQQPAKPFVTAVLDTIRYYFTRFTQFLGF